MAVIDFQDLEHNPKPETRVPNAGVRVHPRAQLRAVRSAGGKPAKGAANTLEPQKPLRRIEQRIARLLRRRSH